MKQYKLLPTCGLALGVALVIATSAFKEAPKAKSGDPVYTFQYNAPSGTDYSASAVQNVANWSYTTDTDPCDGVDVEACKIQVPTSFVNNPGGSPTLKSTINIGTASTSSGLYYVSSTAAGGTGTISNKAE